MATRRNQADEKAAAEVLLTANLRLARKLSGFSQAGLAREAKVDPQQISKWERGVLKPSTQSLSVLAETLGRDLAWFFTEHEPIEEAV